MSEARERREELRAAALGQEGWGQYGSVSEHHRYSFPLPPRLRNRRRCGCGCGGKETHSGCVNGLGMGSGCELSVRRWVRDGTWQHVAAEVRAAEPTPTREDDTRG